MLTSFDLSFINKESKKNILSDSIGLSNCMYCNQPLDGDIHHHHIRDKKNIISKMTKQSIGNIFSEMIKTGPLHGKCHTLLTKKTHRHHLPSVNEKIDRFWRANLGNILKKLINISTTEGLSNPIKLKLMEIPSDIQEKLQEEPENLQYASNILNMNVNEFIKINTNFQNDIVYSCDYLNNITTKMTPVRINYMNMIYDIVYLKGNNRRFNSSTIASHIVYSLDNPEGKIRKTIEKDIGWMISNVLIHDPIYDVDMWKQGCFSGYTIKANKNEQLV